MDAIISDIHGNLEALEAVLEEIDRLGASRIICLGDLVCYGPDSAECIRRSRDWDIVIAGDWDLSLLRLDISQWNQWAQQHIRWLSSQIESSPDADELIQTIRSYKANHTEDRWCFAHGTPNDPFEWIFPETSYEPSTLNRISQEFDAVLACGHSHVQGLFTRLPDETWEYADPTLDQPYDLSQHEKAVVTVGSVGQPRDGKAKAAFVTVEANIVQFHRVEYDIARTVEKIHAIPEIDDLHGDRLFWGR